MRQFEGVAADCGVNAIGGVLSAALDQRDDRTSKRGSPISKNIYGQFLEHGGDIVNSGVWAEMLVDRKFFLPGCLQCAHTSAGDCQCWRQITFSADF